MPRRKSYVDPAIAPSLDPSAGPTASPEVAFIDLSQLLGPAARLVGTKSVDYRSWVDRGIDDWVWACIDGVRSMLAAGTRQPSTVRAVGQSMRYFFAYLCADRAAPLVRCPGELTAIHVAQYAQWLIAKAAAAGWSQPTVRGYFAASKQMLSHLIDQGLIHAPAIDRFFPKAAISAGNGRTQTTPLSDAEQQRLAAALRADLVDHHHGRIELNPSEVATARYLVVAMRSGGNPTPLLEMQRDALVPGLVPGVMGLRTFKYRGHQVHLRASRATPHPITLPLDAVGVLNQAMGDSEELVAHAPEHLRDRVWLYRSALRADRSEIKCLSYEALTRNIGKLVARRRITADDGRPLQVTTGRLRKSLAKRAWRLSDGDAIAVATVLGNAPRVADTNYLGLDEQLLANAAQFIGEELTLLLRGATSRRVIPLADLAAQETSAITPTGRCRDTLYGARAPKDGTTHCDVFAICLFCPSFAIAGELEDLWRLFSYQAFIRAEVEHLEATHGVNDTGDIFLDQIRNLYRRSVAFIDELTGRSFAAQTVAAAKEKAMRQPHPFWSFQAQRLSSGREWTDAEQVDGAHE